MDRTQASGKPVDPATRLSDLLAQSLEELTRPFDPPRPGPQAMRIEPRMEPTASSARPETATEGTPEGSETPLDTRVDADRALAELEAELFAAAKDLDRQGTAGATADAASGHAVDLDEAHHAISGADSTEKTESHDPEQGEKAPPLDSVPEPAIAPGDLEPAPPMDADAERLVARVRRLMLVSMAITVIAVGSVFGFIGYRIFKNEGLTEKKADKLPETSPIPTDVTLTLPRGARVVQSSVAGDRLVITLEIDGKLEVRTFDVGTLQPAGRLNFSATP